jgi:uncharacterized membrane protein
MLFPGVITLVLALTWGGIQYPWSNWRVILLLVTSVTAFVAFALLQVLRPNDATVPFRILSQRSVACACIVGLAIGASSTTIIYYLPLYFQGVKRVTPVRSGVMVLPMVFGEVVFSILAGVGGESSIIPSSPLVNPHVFFHMRMMANNPS